MIRTPNALKAARERLGWSIYELGRALRLEGPREKQGERVRAMENGSKTISGPVSVAVEAFVDGWRPEGFVAEDD